MRWAWRALADWPPVARWSILGASGLLLALLIGTGAWALFQQREAAGRRAFAAVTTTYRQATAEPTEPQLTAAATALRQFLADYPRSAVAPQAWYLLGNVEYQRRAFDAAVTAFAEAARRDAGSVGALSRLGMGYAFEGKGDLPRALDAYREGLQGRDPKDFLYAELLLATARVQEQLNQPAAAIDTYRRFLRELPNAPQAGQVRTRLAILGAAA